MYLCPFLIGLLFGFLDLCFDTFAGMSSVVVVVIIFETVKVIHFLLDKLQTAIDSHYSLGFILLQQNRPDELVDVGFFV